MAVAALRARRTAAFTALRQLRGLAKHAWDTQQAGGGRWSAVRTATGPVGTTVRGTATRGFAASAAGDGPGRIPLAWWMGGCSAWVFSMVVLGGVTRLTRSGLSMTDWKFTGETRPRTQEEWEAEFAKYKRSPEYTKVNSTMTLEEFKFIYWMEYAHRMWGRALGLVFALPCTYFAYKGYVNGVLGKRLALLFAMGGGQGLVGWWMVKSGLEEELLVQHEVPRVSPYRLAAHLTSAFAIYSILAWTTMNLAFPKPVIESLSQSSKQALLKVRGMAIPLSALVGVTAISGAFVAGLDAGHAYNTFPLMEGKLVPSEYFQLSPFWKNLFEDTATVQFNHRALAMTTLGAITAFAWHTRTLPLPPSTRKLIYAVVAMAYAQVTLGVSTLLTYVPVSLGSAHQTGALTLFTLMLGLLHSARRSPSAILSTSPLRVNPSFAQRAVA